MNSNADVQLAILASSAKLTLAKETNVKMDQLAFLIKQDTLASVKLASTVKSASLILAQRIPACMELSVMRSEQILPAPVRMDFLVTFAKQLHVKTFHVRIMGLVQSSIKIFTATVLMASAANTALKGSAVKTHVCTMENVLETETILFANAKMDIPENDAKLPLVRAINA